MRVSDSEKLFVVLYRVEQAQEYLEHKKPRKFLWFNLRPRYGVGWASAHLALQKAKAALGEELAVSEFTLSREKDVKAIEARLWDERERLGGGDEK